MAVDETFTGSVVDGAGPHWSNSRVFGARLRKFSLWHRMCLSALRSPFMIQGEHITTFDLRVAAGVCRTQYRDSRIRKPWLRPSWMWLRGLAVALATRPKKPGEQTYLVKLLQREVEAFLSYCGDYLQAPEHCIIPPRQSPHSAPQRPRGRMPDEFEHVAELIGWTHYPLAVIWNLPLGEANWMRIAARRAAGMDVDMTTPEQVEFMAGLPPEYRSDYRPTQN